jgi:hypothetical protein
VSDVCVLWQDLTETHLNECVEEYEDLGLLEVDDSKWARDCESEWEEKGGD